MNMFFRGQSAKLVAGMSCLFALSACGSGDETSNAQTSAPANGSGTGAGGSGLGGNGSAAGGGNVGGGNAGGFGQGGSNSSVSDPNADGPYGTATIDSTINVAATGNTVGIHCAYPTDGPSAGPYPVVVVGHGFQLPPSQYYSYVERLASFGYVALTVDFQTSLLSANNVAQAQELSAGLDWASSDGTVASISNVDLAGATGHSLGGKVALLAATMDGRFKASITLDPVDGAMNCSPQNCPDVSALLPINIPIGFLGETLDATGALQACAPAADNFQTFYANTSAPSLSVEVLGANHMSFLDDLAGCGFTCSFCNMPTLDNATVNAMSRAYVVAFYERYLRNNTGYDTYLTGSEAQQRYVTPGLATISSK